MKLKFLFLSLVFILFSCGKSKKELEAEKKYNDMMNGLQNLPRYEVRNEVCPDCRGTGKTNCSNCSGDGKVAKTIESVEGTKLVVNDIEMCSNCNGFGYYVCKKCGGGGIIKVEVQK